MMKEESFAPLEVTNNEFLRQFEVTINGNLATIEYAQQERKIFLTKLCMNDDLKEKGYPNSFIKKVLEKLEDTNLRVMPTSPEIVSFFKKNRRYKQMLPVGINI